MSDEREPSSEVSRRRFLTVLGTTSAGAAVLSGCSTEKVEKLIPYLVQSEDQVPGHPDLVRQHVHRVQCRVRPARAGSRRPSRQARGQSRQSDQQGRPLRPGAGRPAGALQPGARARADGEAGRHLEGDQLGRCDRDAGAEGRRGGRQARRHLRGGAGHLLQLPRRLGRRPRAGAWCATSRSTSSRCAPPMRASSAAMRSRHTTSARRSTSSPSARSSSRPSARPPSTSSATPSRTASPRDASRPSTSTSRPARRSPGLNADEWHAVVPGSETSLALAMAGVLLQQRGGSVSGMPSVSVDEAAEGDGPVGGDDHAAGEGVCGGEPEPRGGGWHREPDGRRHRALRRGQPAQLRGRQRGPDGALRRRSRSWRRLRRARGAVEVDGGRRGRGAAGARGQPGLHRAARHEVRRGARARCRSRSRPRCTSTRRRRRPTCSCRATMRSSAGTTSTPRMATGA